jgi:hypothetical protein
MPRWTWTAVVLVMLMGSAGELLRAQVPAAPAPAFDVSKLPVDLDRVQRKLREALDASQKEPLVVRFTVNVFAEAPRVDLFTPRDDLKFAPVRSVAPMHREMMNIVTPAPWGRR